MSAIATTRVDGGSDASVRPNPSFHASTGFTPVARGWWPRAFASTTRSGGSAANSSSTPRRHVSHATNGLPEFSFGMSADGHDRLVCVTNRSPLSVA